MTKLWHFSHKVFAYTFRLAWCPLVCYLGLFSILQPQSCLAAACIFVYISQSATFDSSGQVTQKSTTAFRCVKNGGSQLKKKR